MGEIAKIMLCAVLAIAFALWFAVVLVKVAKRDDDDDNLPPPPGAVVAGLVILAVAGAST